MDEPLSPRQFLRRYNLPQLVRIHDAHLHQLNASRGSMGAGNSAEQTHKRHQPPQQELMKAITSKGSSGLATIKSSLDSTGTNTTGSESSSNSRTKSCSISRGNPLGVFPVKLNNLRPTSEVQFEPSTSSSSHRHSCFGLKSPEEEGEQQQQQQQPDEDKLLDLDQPFLLYEAYSSRQIIAYSLDISSSSPMSTTSATTNTSGPTNIDLRASKRVGPALLIPESYSGWFSLVTRGGQTAGYFTTVDELVRAQVPYFMTREDLEAHLLFKETTVYANGTQKPSVTTTNNSCGSLIVKSGTVLRCLGVYEDISPVILGLDKSKKATLRAKKEVLFAIEPVNRYLKCIAYTGGPSGGQMVFVSLSTTGKFYLIAKANSKSLSYNCVYSMKHLMHMVRLPTTVHLVVGPKPKNYLPSASSSTILYNSSTNLNGSSSKKKDSNEGDVTMFSATLYLEEIRVRDVILACTLSSDPFTNLSNNSETTNNVLTTGKSRTNSITASFKRSLRGSRFLRKLKADVPTLLEFDLDASFNFIRTFIDSASGSGNKFGGTLSSRKLPELVLQRLRYCQAEAELWRQQIKISHDITPKRYMYRSLQHLSQSSSSGQHQWQVEHQEPQQHHQLFRERDCPTPPKPPARHRRERCNRILEEDNQKIQDLTEGRDVELDIEVENEAYLAKLEKKMVPKGASIGSRASNASNASKVSRILQRIWNPSRRLPLSSSSTRTTSCSSSKVTKPMNSSRTSINGSKLNLETHIIPEAEDSEEENEKQGMSLGMSTKEPEEKEEDTMSREDLLPLSIIDDTHLYETISKATGNSLVNIITNSSNKTTFDHKNNNQNTGELVPGTNGKPKLIRKKTLDIIFPELKIDSNGYVLSAKSPLESNIPTEYF